MPMRRKKSKAGFKRFFRFNKAEKGFLLLMALAAILVIGGTTDAFSVLAGEGSDWGADVEILAVGYGSTGYARANVVGDVVLNGPRVVTVDYDGKVDVSSLSETDYVWAGFTHTTKYAATGTDGMMPTVTHAVGNFFYANEDGQKVLAPYRVYEETGADIGNVHYYYGFSVMFTTRASLDPVFDVTSIALPDMAGTIPARTEGTPATAIDGIVTRDIPAISDITAMTQVGIKIESLVDNFDYVGTVNEIKIVNERARYTIAESISGVSSDLATFNRDYGWEEYYMHGTATGQSPRLVYDVIDSETENMATVELKANLRIGLDTFQTDSTFMTGELLSYKTEGYEFVRNVNVYNVEYIYDVVVDLSINGVPISDWMGNWAEGTADGTLPADEPEFGMNWMLLGVIAMGAFFGLAILRKLMG